MTSLVFVNFGDDVITSFVFVNFGDDVIIWALFGTGIRTPISRDWLVCLLSNLACDTLTIMP